MQTKLTKGYITKADNFRTTWDQRNVANFASNPLLRVLNSELGPLACFDNSENEPWSTILNGLWQSPCQCPTNAPVGLYVMKALSGINEVITQGPLDIVTPALITKSRKDFFFERMHLKINGCKNIDSKKHQGITGPLIVETIGGSHFCKVS